MKTFLTLAFLFGLCSLPVLAGESRELGPLDPEKRRVKEDVLPAAQVQAVDAPAGEALSEDYQLTIAGRKVPVYACRVSAVPLNQVWPGYQRPLDQTVYLAAGAVVCGSIQARSASKIRIGGRGIIDVSPYERGKGGGEIRLTDCSDAIMEGIVMRDPDEWYCSLFGCRNVTISDVKLVGLWRYNADGIDVCNSENVIVKDSFVRAFDDAPVIKGLKFGRDSFDDRPVRDVRFSRCVIWCDWGRAMEIGAETCAPEIAGIVFEDCDIVRTMHIAMDIQHGDRATIRDIRFENIRVEIDDWNPPPRMQQAKDEKYPEKPGDTYCPTLFEIVIRKNSYSKDESRGSVRDVVFKDITVTSRREPRSSFRGLDAEHGVEGVTIQNLRFNGRPVGNAQEAHLDIGPHVKEVRFSGAAAAPPGK